MINESLYYIYGKRLRVKNMDEIYSQGIVYIIFGTVISTVNNLSFLNLVELNVANIISYSYIHIFI